MSDNQSNQNSQEAPSVSPQVTPTGIGYGHPEFHFVQSVMELQKSNAEISTNLAHLVKSVDSLKSKVDDLVKWKTLVIGGAITIGFLVVSQFEAKGYIFQILGGQRLVPRYSV